MRGGKNGSRIRLERSGNSSPTIKNYKLAGDLYGCFNGRQYRLRAICDTLAGRLRPLREVSRVKRRRRSPLLAGPLRGFHGAESRGGRTDGGISSSAKFFTSHRTQSRLSPFISSMYPVLPGWSTAGRGARAAERDFEVASKSLRSRLSEILRLKLTRRARAGILLFHSGGRANSSREHRVVSVLVETHAVYVDIRAWFLSCVISRRNTASDRTRTVIVRKKEARLDCTSS